MTTENTNREPDPVANALQPISQRNLPILSERFQPRNLTELMEWAKLVVASNLAPKGMNAAGVVLCVQMGAELGISPAQAIQNIAVINGRPCVWGDLGLAIFRRDAPYKSIEEDAPDVALKQGYGRCKIVMQNGTVIERRFSIEEAKAAQLWGKNSPWSTFPGRMLMWRARWWAMRDAAPEVFKGLAAAEEQYDLVATTSDGVEIEQPRAKATSSSSTAPAPGASDGFEQVERFVQEVGGPAPAAASTAAAPAPTAAGGAGANANPPNPYPGRIANLESRKGDKGKQSWTLYVIKLEDGTLWSTFDHRVIEKARELGQGVDVLLHWKVSQDGRYRNVWAIDPKLPEQSDAAEPAEPTAMPTTTTNLFDVPGATS